MRHASVLVVLLACTSLVRAEAPASAKEALQAFNDLVGSWKATGTPAGLREDAARNFWIESIECEWQFKGDDAWLTLKFGNGKHFTKGELRWLPKTKEFQLLIDTVSKEKLTFTGLLDKRTLTVARRFKDEDQRLVFSLLHSNRFLYRYETKPSAKAVYSKHYTVGATKEGEPFAVGSGKPECIVSGGLGTSTVTYMGKTYYVCCSGCRAEFNENPAKYVAEWEAKQKKK
jgi:hypothetical protein